MDKTQVRQRLFRPFLILLCLSLWVIIFCLGFEIYFRIKGYYKLEKFIVGDCGWNGTLKQGVHEDLVLSDNPGLGWELGPKKLINSYGRFKKGKQKRPQGIFRILALGDSITQMGNWRLLEEKLNSSGFNYRFEVWNCGVSGYDISNYYYYLKERALNFDANLIILCFCLKDFNPSKLIIFDGKRYLEFPNPFNVTKLPFVRILFLRSHLYRFIVFNSGKAILNNETGMKGILTDRFNEMLNICHQRGIRVIAIIWPYLKSNYNIQEKQEYLTLRTLLESGKVPYIDCHKSLPERDDPSLRASPDEYIHPSEKAFQIMVEDIYPFISSYLKNENEFKQK